METVFIIVAALIFTILGCQYCKKSVEISGELHNAENLLPEKTTTNKEQDEMGTLVLKTASNLKNGLKYSDVDVSITIPTQKEILNIYTSCYIDDKDSKVTLKKMYEYYLTFSENLVFSNKPYLYANFCKEIRKQFNVHDIKEKNKVIATMYGKKYAPDWRYK